MFNELKRLTSKPKLYNTYTAKELWNDDHISKQMLYFHLDAENDLASRSADKVDKIIDFLTKRLSIDTSTSVIDFGCGPGLYASRLAATGAAITGVDFSSRSIEYAKEEAKKSRTGINYILSDYLKFESDQKFDLAMLIYFDLCPLSKDQRGQLLSNIHKHLKEDGRFVFDVLSLPAFKKRKELIQIENNLMNGFWANSDYYGVLQTFLYEESNVVLDKYDIFMENYEFTIYNWLKHFDLKEIQEELKLAGFEIESYYSNLMGTEYSESSDEISIIARKAKKSKE